VIAVGFFFRIGWELVDKVGFLSDWLGLDHPRP
jgi:hypothetical protein